MLVLGLGGTSKNPEIMEFGVSGLSHNEIGILLYQSEAENSINLLKVLFKYISTINGPKMAIFVSVFFL